MSFILQDAAPARGFLRGAGGGSGCLLRIFSVQLILLLTLDSLHHLIRTTVL